MENEPEPTELEALNDAFDVLLDRVRREARINNALVEIVRKQAREIARLKADLAQLELIVSSKQPIGESTSEHAHDPSEHKAVSNDH